MTQSKKRVLTKSVVKKIKTLLKEGKSRSQIVKDLKIRKKTGLDWIRQVTKTRKNKRLTEIGQRARLFKKPLTINQQNMVTDLYRQGYSKEFIKKIFYVFNGIKLCCSISQNRNPVTVFFSAKFRIWIFFKSFSILYE